MEESLLAIGPTEGLEGELVEIFGVEELLEPSEEAKGERPDIEPLDVNGLRGRAVGWSWQDRKYVVETFDGLVVGVRGHNLRVFVPDAPEDGGFDVAWPSGPVEPETFAGQVSDIVARKGWCLIQMFAAETLRKEAVLEALDVVDWHLPAKDFEVQYMGYENTTKYADLDANNYLEKEPEDSLQQFDSMLADLGQFMAPFAPDYLGFDVWGRQPGQVRVPYSPAEERVLRPRELTEDDYEEGGRVHAHLDFVERRKLFAMYMVESAGGSLWLYPTGRADAVSTCIPLSSNKLLVILPDVMTYSYRPQGDSLLLQSWFVTEPAIAGKDDERVIELPERQKGERVHVNALQGRHAGGAHSPLETWCMFITGSDCSRELPKVRFDYDYFYNEDGSGLMYTNHFAGVHERMIQGFDPEFFGITHYEAESMSPGQRNVLEVGYSTLYAAGYGKAECRGMPCGFYIGDAGTDWPTQGAIPKIRDQAAIGEINPHVYNGFGVGVRCSRLSHILDMKGPVVSVDTACSSSLVAAGQAHRTLVTRKGNQLSPTADANIDKAVVMGLCLDDGCATFIAYCQAQMLSTGGRSFTFDESANGFMRGEGCGGLFLKRSYADSDAQYMLACVIGTNVNQDGRSASMTAPNGPSQQQCIKASMAEAGLTPSMITIAECHGTGTALGDPIEVGALRDVMMDRGEDAIIMTSSKVNFGHMEADAGIGGLSKCILMLNAMTGAANIHLRHLNPHIEYVGYPACFNDEHVDCGTSTGVSGVSSFGVGGTNARGDLWGRSRLGYLATEGVRTREKEALQTAKLMHMQINGRPGPGPDDTLNIVGTWDARSKSVEMTPTAVGEYTAIVSLGDVVRESFHILMNDDKDQVIHPAFSTSDQHAAEICGPDVDSSGKSWVLDGRSEGATVYCIRLLWEFSWETGERRHIQWERHEGPEPPQADGMAFRHHYSIIGSWTAWKCLPMQSSNAEPGLYEIKVRIGTTCMERFQFVRDRDYMQVLHPERANSEDETVPVRGPDSDGRGKHWVIRGDTGEHVLVQLRITPEAISVSVNSPNNGSKTWTSTEVEADEL